MTTFSKDIKRGKKGEEFLDNWFHEQGVTITHVDLDTEIAHGIDRIFTWNGKSTKVEYKTDYASVRTNNIFIELWIEESTGEIRPGWAVKSQSDIIITLAGRDQYAGIYFMRTSELRNKLKMLSELPVRNGKTNVSLTKGHTFHAVGVTPSITEYAAHCYKFVPVTHIKGVF